MSGHSGHVAHHLLPTCYCMHKDLNCLKITCKTNEEVSPFMSRQVKHAGEEKDLMCNSLKDLFFNDEISLL